MSRSTNRRAMIIGASAVTAAAVLALGATMVANAASPTSTSTTSPSTSTESTQPAPGTGTPPKGVVGDATHGAPGETVLTGDTATKVKAAALKAVPGATVVRVETDSGSAQYEAHVTTSDGTAKTVKVNADFTVAAVQDGMGQGPAGQKAPTTSSGA